MTTWKEKLIDNGEVVVMCPCREPKTRGHYHPLCANYCQRCNYDAHMCPGCGTVTDHNDSLCQDCEEDFYG